MLLTMILTTKGMNWDGEGFVLLTAVTITEVSPSLIFLKKKKEKEVTKS